MGERSFVTAEWLGTETRRMSPDVCLRHTYINQREYQAVMWLLYGHTVAHQRDWANPRWTSVFASSQPLAQMQPITIFISHTPQAEIFSAKRLIGKIKKFPLYPGLLFSRSSSPLFLVVHLFVDGFWTERLFKPIAFFVSPVESVSVFVFCACFLRLISLNSSQDSRPAVPH